VLGICLRGVDGVGGRRVSYGWVFFFCLVLVRVWDLVGSWGGVGLGWVGGGGFSSGFFCSVWGFLVMWVFLWGWERGSHSVFFFWWVWFFFCAVGWWVFFFFFFAGALPVLILVSRP